MKLFRFEANVTGRCTVLIPARSLEEACSIYEGEIEGEIEAEAGSAEWESECEGRGDHNFVEEVYPEKKSNGKK